MKMQCGHLCKGKCHAGLIHQVCKEVDIARLDCGHLGRVPCSVSPDLLECEEPWYVKTLSMLHWLTVFYSKKVLPCKHHCLLKCYQACDPALCKTCRQIEYAAYEQQQVMIAEERKLRVKEAMAESKRITEEYKKNPMTHFTTKITDPATINNLRDLVSKYVQPDHQCFLEVTEALEITNLKLLSDFTALRAELNDPRQDYRLLFHGTGDEGVKGISKEGFRLPDPNRKNMFGRGIYFATDSSKSAQEIYTKGSNTLLLCHVWLGKTHTYAPSPP